MSAMTVKGQVTIPKSVREELGLKPGCDVTFTKENGRFYIQSGDEAARADYLRRIKSVTGIVNLGMTTDAYMKLLRGDDP